jgi:MFS family permease
MKELKLKIKNFNRVALLLTLADVFTWAPLFIISALSGIYLSDKLGKNTIEFVGIGMGISYITRAIFQLPVGKLTDKLKKDRDEIYMLALGVTLTGLSFALYPLINETWHYYVLQFLFGLGISLDVVNWRKLFAINVTKGMEGEEYAVYDTVVSTATAVFAVISGVIANLGDQYFDFVMLGAGIFIMLASIWILKIPKVKDRQSKKEI